jgi:sec-independent protein translocase protein TatB
MFDVGFIEMIVVGVIALIVLGPERLPGAVRTVGLTVGRIKRGFADVRSQVEREIGADEIRQQLHNERIMENLEKLEKSANSHVVKPASNVKQGGNKTVTQDQQTPPASEVTPTAEAATAPTETPAEDASTRTHER